MSDNLKELNIPYFRYFFQKVVILHILSIFILLYIPFSGDEGPVKADYLQASFFVLLFPFLKYLIIPINKLEHGRRSFTCISLAVLFIVLDISMIIFIISGGFESMEEYKLTSDMKTAAVLSLFCSILITIRKAFKVEDFYILKDCCLSCKDCFGTDIGDVDPLE